LILLVELTMGLLLSGFRDQPGGRLSEDQTPDYIHGLISGLDPEA
jgi:hypothetical protein